MCVQLNTSSLFTFGYKKLKIWTEDFDIALLYSLGVDSRRLKSNFEHIEAEIIKSKTHLLVQRLIFRFNQPWQKTSINPAPPQICGIWEKCSINFNKISTGDHPRNGKWLCNHALARFRGHPQFNKVVMSVKNGLAKSCWGAVLKQSPSICPAL